MTQGDQYRIIYKFIKDDLSSVFAYHTTSKSTFFLIKKTYFHMSC